MYRKYIKRLLDIIFSFSFIVILSPLFLITGFLVWIELGFPIFFLQLREGKNKKAYTMYKFRTMVPDTSLERDERMTKITAFLDKYRFNELPQLFNVLKGDMSLVGPRPFIPGEVLPKAPMKERYYVKPGMTGLAQAKGGRHISHNKKLEYDVIYYEKLSFWLDLKIILLTPISLIKG